MEQRDRCWVQMEFAEARSALERVQRGRVQYGSIIILETGGFSRATDTSIDTRIF